MKKTTNMKCDNCDNGIVMLIVTKRGDSITAEVKDCNVCKKHFGIKSISALSEIRPIQI